MEALKRLPPWARKVLVVTTIIGPLCGATWTVATTVIDINARASDAKARSTASYETLAPAVKELQGLSAEAQGWVNDAHRRIAELEQYREDLEKRVIRLEGYIEALGRRRSLPRAPAPVKKEKSRPERTPSMKRPVRLVPEGIQQAKDFQKKRVRLDCAVDDPLCGALE